MERTVHDGRTTAYRVVDRGGDGAPILCVHGSGGTHAVWRGQFALADERPVAALDLSGHGDSGDVDADPGDPALSAYADDVAAVARETGARVLMGNSLGGAVVLHLALSGFDPDALVLAGTGAKLSVLPELLDWLREDFERAVEFLHGPDRLLHTRDERHLEASRRAMVDAGRRVTRRDFETCDRFDVRGRLGEIDAPALALTGAHDELTPPAYHEYLAENLPGGRWTTVDGAAHLSMLERPDAFNGAVSGFLREVA